MNALGGSHFSTRNHSPGFLYLVSAVVGCAFFLSEHSLEVSLQDAYTSTEEQMEKQASGGNLIRRLVFLSLGLLGALLLIQPGKDRFHPTMILATPIVLYCGWCALSLVWSSDPGMTIRRLSVMTCFLLGAAGLAKALSLQDLLKLCVLVTLGSLLIGIAAEIRLGTFRPRAGDYRFSGTLHPNTQGLYLTTLCLASFCLMRQAAPLRGMLLAFLLGFGFLILTKSRTSCAGMLFSLTPLWALRSSKGGLFLIVLGAGWLLSFAAVVFLVGGVDLAGNLSQAALLGRQEQAESLTGRLPIWSAVQPYLEKELVLGYGYDSFWITERIDEISSELHWGIRESHSAYLDTMLSVGLIGGILLLLVVLLSMTQAARLYLKSNNTVFGFLFGLLLFGLINAFTESGMIMPLFVPFVALTGILHLAFFHSSMDPQPLGTPALPAYPRSSRLRLT